MKLSFTSLFVLLTGATLIVAGCKKKTDTYPSDPVSDYMNLEVGKYIDYRLDSTIYINYGQADTVITYDARDKVEAETTDNLGRPSWRVVRYLRDTASTNESDWQPSLTYLVTPTRDNIEVVENNFRQVKLKIPVQDGYSWLGNRYLPDDPYMSLYPFSNDEDMQYWNYTYQDVNASQVIDNNSYDSTITVMQVEDSVNVPIVYPDGIAYKNYWIEKYAKGIGLLYKEVIMWEYQPPRGSDPGYKQGFGIKLTIVGHN